ncbi:hypothetical protein SK128_022807 [Halocaridina rubra]|uniref:Unconventional myosin-XV n=1 Tax=Halocaridina rubra TaxID=373956 RepID=A0AAN8WBJ9_HALRR
MKHNALSSKVAMIPDPDYSDIEHDSLEPLDKILETQVKPGFALNPTYALPEDTLGIKFLRQDIIESANQKCHIKTSEGDVERHKDNVIADHNTEGVSNHLTVPLEQHVPEDTHVDKSVLEWKFLKDIVEIQDTTVGNDSKVKSLFSKESENWRHLQRWVEEGLTCNEEYSVVKKRDEEKFMDIYNSVCEDISIQGSIRNLSNAESIEVNEHERTSITSYSRDSWDLSSPSVSVYPHVSFIDEEDPYNPSLPPIPILDSLVDPNIEIIETDRKSKDRLPVRSKLREITAISPPLDDWHDTMSATSRLGWALILYHGVRNKFKPHAFARLAFQGSREFVRAVADYVTRESTLLSFKKGDIIRVTSQDRYGDSGWLQGSLDGRTGMFPVEYVSPIARSEARYAVKHSKVDHIDSSLLENESSIHNVSVSSQQHTTHVTLAHSHHDDSGHSSGGEGTAVMALNGNSAIVHDGKHSLLQFALQHFRLSKEQGLIQSNGTLQTNTKSKKKKNNKDHQAEWTWKEQVEMVKFSQSPLTQSLLPLEPELSQLGVENFLAVMRYMGDYPMQSLNTEVHCVYTILMNCHKHLLLRDEVYCQIMKQTTNNKSSIPDSCQRGWRLFCIVAAYFTCSENLKPYLFKYLETAAYDKRRAYHGTAMVCLQNLRKTFKYGGRKNVPSIEEITAITAGRNSKRQIYRLPGGTERVINTKSTSVVQDIIEEMCQLISVRSPHEQEEYSLYCIVEGDTFTMPLAREEYILDVTTELQKNQQVFYLIFCRSVWYYPLRSDNALYYEVVFNQIAPDYLEGLLLVTPGEQLQQDVIYDIAKVAALLHRAADLEDVPTMKEVKYLLPKPALTVRDVKPPQWVNMVQQAWVEVAPMTSLQAKAQVLEILQSWPLFGSSFFAVKRVTENKEHTDHILALNKNGVHFLDLLTHETVIKYSLPEVLSTRKVKNGDSLYLDMKCGNLMQQRITQIQTDQAHEISRLIRQYITIEQRTLGSQPRGDIPSDVTLSR